MGLVKRDSIFANILYYASGSLFQKFLAIFTAFLRPKLLSPELFGLWSVLSVLPNYASYLHLGSRSSLRFLVPYYESRDDQEAIESAKAAVLRGTLVPTLVAVLCLLLCAVFWDTGLETRVGLIAIGLVILLNWRFDYLIGVLKSHQHFRLIARCYYLTAAAHLVLTASLIFFFGFYGVLLAAILTLVVGIIYLQRMHAFPAPGPFRSEVFGRLVKMGLPIVTFNLLSELIRTSDRFVIYFLLGEQTVGYYGIAIMMLGFALSIPAISREVVEPRLMANLESATVAQNVERFMTRPLLNTAYLMPFVIGPAVLLLPWIIAVLLPDYVPGITAAQILLIGGYFLAVSHALRGVIVALDLQIHASIIALAILVVNVTLSLTAVHLGYGTEGVALASSMAFFLMFATLLSFLWWRMRAKHHRLELPLVALSAPFGLMCVLLYLAHEFSADAIEAGFAAHAGALAFFMIFQGLLLYAVRQRGMVSFRIDPP